MARGLYQSSFSTGNDADKPVEYPAATNVALYWAEDTGILYARAYGNPDWTPAFTLPEPGPDTRGGVLQVELPADPGTATVADLVTLLEAAGVFKAGA